MAEMKSTRTLLRRCVLVALLLAAIYAHAAPESLIERDPSSAAEVDSVASLLYMNGAVLAFLGFVFLKPFLSRRKKSS